MDRLTVFQNASGGGGAGGGFSSGTEAFYSGTEDLGGTGKYNSGVYCMVHRLSGFSS